jgi:hypothetical protein
MDSPVSEEDRTERHSVQAQSDQRTQFRVDWQFRSFRRILSATPQKMTFLTKFCNISLIKRSQIVGR